MRIIDRSAQRRHGLNASAFNSSMCFGEFFLECPCCIAVPIDRAERLVGFRCIRLYRHQVISVVAFDDAAGGISVCVQRVYRDNMSGKRHFFEKRRDGGSLATLVMKTVTGNGQRRVIRVGPALICCRNSFSSSNDGTASRVHLRREDRAGPAAAPPHLSFPPAVGPN